MNMGLLFSVGIGGFIGAILRFTLSVNILGSFLIGFLFLYFQHINLSVYQKSLLITGLLGALTTFSTFSLDTVLLMQNELYIKAVSSVVLNVIFSILGTVLGMWVFKRVYLPIV